MKLEMSKIEKFKKNELQNTEFKSVFGGLRIVYEYDQYGKKIGWHYEGVQSSGNGGGAGDGTDNTTVGSILP